MKRHLLLGSLLALGGCASAPAPARTTPAEEARAIAADPRDETVRAQRARIRELEAQLALAHAEAGALRSELRDVEASVRAQTTRIVHAPEAEAPRTEEPVASGPRPLLRLHGPAPSAASVRVLEPIPGPPAPAVAAAPPPPSLRLPVGGAPGFDRAFDPQAGVPQIPEAPVVVAPSPAPAPAPARDDGAIRRYREALAHVSARRLDEALAALDAFLRDHPGHPYAGNAMYWRGEIHYARRDYRRALAELTALVERYPRGNKIPEALLRIGLCHARMGDAARARQVFERLRTDHPRSVAARMVPQEDA